MDRADQVKLVCPASWLYFIMPPTGPHFEIYGRHLYSCQQSPQNKGLARRHIENDSRLIKLRGRYPGGITFGRTDHHRLVMPRFTWPEARRTGGRVILFQKFAKPPKGFTQAGLAAAVDCDSSHGRLVILEHKRFCISVAPNYTIPAATHFFTRQIFFCGKNIGRRRHILVTILFLGFVMLEMVELLN